MSVEPFASRKISHTFALMLTIGEKVIAHCVGKNFHCFLASRDAQVFFCTVLDLDKPSVLKIIS